jgi:hypothetical protein
MVSSNSGPRGRWFESSHSDERILVNESLQGFFVPQIGLNGKQIMPNSCKYRTNCAGFKVFDKLISVSYYEIRPLCILILTIMYIITPIIPLPMGAHRKKNGKIMSSDTLHSSLRKIVISKPVMK